MNELQTVVEILCIKQVIREREEYRNFTISSPDDAAEIITKEIADLDREVFMVLCLNTKNQIQAIHQCHIGSINASIAHPREIFKSAILNNSASLIVGHNHPSGDPTPSNEDIQVTRRLKEAGNLLGIELLDSLIVGPTKFISLKEKGYL